MIKIKKTLLGTLLSCLMVVCLCFGIVHIKSDTKNVFAATVQTEPSVTNVHLRGTNKLLFFLSASDYANTGATTVIEAKAFTDYNTLDKIVCIRRAGSKVSVRR